MVSGLLPETRIEKETATASNGKENPATKRKMAKRAMNAESVTEGIYTISQTDGKFKVVGGSLTEDGENLNSLTDAFNKILSFGTDTNININFDNVNISSGAPKLTKGCELTLKGTYTSAVEAETKCHRQYQINQQKSPSAVLRRQIRKPPDIPQPHSRPCLLYTSRCV